MDTLTLEIFDELDQKLNFEQDENYCESTTNNLSQEQRNQLVKDHMYLVGLYASKFDGSNTPDIDRDDVHQLFAIELMKLSERFNPNGGCSFKTYATNRLKLAIVDIYRMINSNVGYTRNVYETIKLVEETRNRMMVSLGRYPTIDELSKATKLPKDKIYQAQLIKHNSFTPSLDEEWESDDNEPMCLADILGAIDPEVTRFELRNLITEAAKELTPRHRLLLQLHFYDGLTLKEISQLLTLSEARISQLKNQALTIMKKELERPLKKKDAAEPNKQEMVTQNKPKEDTKMETTLENLPLLTLNQVKVAVLIWRCCLDGKKQAICQGWIAQVVSILSSEVCKVINILTNHDIIKKSGVGGAIQEIKRGKISKFRAKFYGKKELQLSEGLILTTGNTYDLGEIAAQLGSQSPEKTVKSTRKPKLLKPSADSQTTVEEIADERRIDGNTITLLSNYQLKLELDRQQAESEINDARTNFRNAQERLEKALGARALIVEELERVSSAMKK